MCDTFVVLPEATANHAVIFGKNSDREPGEAQSLEFHRAQTHPEGAKLRCTFTEIPQARETFAVLLSRPFWMWGAEMGVNEKGVTIGNEAVFTKMPASRKAGHLLGMDLLRLALERAASAQAALDCMIALLSDYGQGGIAGYRDRRMTYHNSFLIADPTEAWIFETAGPYWAARRVRTRAAISNALTIGEDWDRIHPDAILNAQDSGFTERGKPFHFARAYSDWFFTTFSASRARRRRATRCIAAEGRPFDLPDAFALLRDHGDGQNDPYQPDDRLLGDTICAHAANPLARNATQTTGSLVTVLSPGNLIAWATGTSAPCTSLFKPIRLEDAAHLDFGLAPTATFDSRSLWWRHERLHRTLLVDWKSRTEGLAIGRNLIENDWIRRAQTEMSMELSREAFTQADAWAEQKRKEVAARPIQHRPGLVHRRYWQAENTRAEMPDLNAP